MTFIDKVSKTFGFQDFGFHNLDPHHKKNRSYYDFKNLETI